MRLVASIVISISAQGTQETNTAVTVSVSEKVVLKHQYHLIQTIVQT
jgi:hypothetical protein